MGKLTQKWLPKMSGKTSMKLTITKIVKEASSGSSIKETSVDLVEQEIGDQQKVVDRGKWAWVEDKIVIAIHHVDYVDHSVGIASSANKRKMSLQSDIIVQAKKPRKTSAGVKIVVQSIKARKKQSKEGITSITRASQTSSNNSLAQ